MDKERLEDELSNLKFAYHIIKNDLKEHYIAITTLNERILALRKMIMELANSKSPEEKSKILYECDMIGGIIEQQIINWEWGEKK